MFERIRDDAFGLIRRKRRRIGEQLAADVHCDAGAVSARRNIKNLLKSPDVSVIRGAKEQACSYGSFFKPFFLTIQFLLKSDGNGIGISLISLNGLFLAVLGLHPHRGSECEERRQGDKQQSDQLLVLQAADSHCRPRFGIAAAMRPT
ncbi:hypothetical protein [Sutterella wadsworthensis]|uniref:hypothetical protein n=1 Tax=Sutterella wadsworthensis TaxID=40545 RepID=UPI00307D59AE